MCFFGKQGTESAGTESAMSNLCFFAIGDWGHACDGTKELAAAMSKYADVTKRSPDFILALGDNFYPHGVESVEDPQFKESWSDVFLRKEKLRVPWKVVLGNHDYMGNYQAEIDFTKDVRNEGGFWQCPAKNYKFSHTFIPQGSSPVTVDFFALDTNGCQGHVRKAYPDAAKNLFDYKAALSADLTDSRADFKIVFAHHPMYTKGKFHGVIGRCLRDEVYSAGEASNLQGYGLESVLSDGGVAAYFTGHEHCMQHHVAEGVHSFVCGATGAEPSSLYGGPDEQASIDWYDEQLRCGFAAAVVEKDAMTVRFISVGGEVLREAIIPRAPRAAHGPPAQPTV